MEGFVGMLALAGGFGLALGLTMLGMNLVLSIMPSRRSSASSAVSTSARPE